MNNYKIIFESESSTYTLKIENSNLIFENDQPNVTIISDSSTDTDKAPFDSTQEPLGNSGKIYKITKGTNWQKGLKVGETDIVIDFKVDSSMEAGLNTLLFSVDDHQKYEINLSFEFVTITKKSDNVKQLFPIDENGLSIYIQKGKFSLFK